jgi:hypothetical protein
MTNDDILECDAWMAARLPDIMHNLGENAGRDVSKSEEHREIAMQIAGLEYKLVVLRRQIEELEHTPRI